MTKNISLKNYFLVDHLYDEDLDDNDEIDNMFNLTVQPLRKLLNEKLFQMELDKQPTVYIFLDNLYKPPEDNSLLAHCTQDVLLTSETIILSESSVTATVSTTIYPIFFI
jgi:hypothetical protein